MPTPFPGMDPYLEDPAYWPDVHNGLATYLRDELHPQITPSYYAHVGERVYVLEPSHAVIQDVVVAQARKGEFEQYCLSIRDRLPRIPIPLTPPDPDVTVDLQALLARCY